VSKNRVERAWLEIVKDFATTYWDKELEEAKQLFDVPYPQSDEKDYIKQTTFLDNAKRNKLMMLKYLAQSVSGNIHPVGSNTQAEKQEASKLIQLAEKRIQKSKTNV
jgi:hypothetical protein